MQQTLKTSFLKTLFSAKRRETLEPKKVLQPIDARHLSHVAGGTPRNGWQ
jgi:hypothetical protein